MFFRALPWLLLAALLPGQTKTVPLLTPDGKPIIGADGKPATMTLEQVPAVVVPDLSKIPSGRVLITVGEEKITAADFAAYLQTLPQHMRAAAAGAERRAFAEEVARIRLLAAEAKRRKLDQSPAFQAQQVFATSKLLAELASEELLAVAAPSQAEERAWYEQHQQDYETVHARHILVRMKGSRAPLKPEQKDLTEEEALAKARELHTKLRAGADFAGLAQAESDDSINAAKGGDLGFLRRGQTVPAFEEAVFKTPAGQITEPVQTPFGYHIIKVEAKGVRRFEQVRDEVAQKLREQSAAKKLNELREASPVKFDPSFFGE